MTSLLDVLNARRAAGDTNALSSSAGSVSGRSARSLGTLSREGIHASHSQRIISNTHTPAHAHTAAHNPQRSSGHTLWAQLLPRREQWRELGEGWWQASSAESGAISRAGLHSVVESQGARLLSCVYLPRSASASQAINGSPHRRSTSLFTGVRYGGDNKEKQRQYREFNGLLGLAVHGGRFALKGWKLRGQVSRSSSAAQSTSLIHSVEEVRQSQSMSERRSSRSIVLPRSAVSDEREKDRERGEQFTPRTVNALPENASQSQLLRHRLESVLGESFEKCIVDCVLSELISIDVGVSFDDIASLAHAKRILHEAIVLPTIMPEFFTGIREPWKGILLYGPPGTGKTMLAKATCSLKKATFFSCSASALISKFRGDSEKIIRCLFTAARFASPSVIFLDEIDALASKRSSDGEHEASRRMKTELFAQIDGLTSKVQGNNSVVVLAATNIPWELDLAMLRRLEKRIYIPLPDEQARLNCFQLFLKGMQLRPDVDLREMTRLTEGYSGADLQILCRDAAMMPMRRLLEICSIEDLEQMKQEGTLANPTIAMADFLGALQNVRKTIPVSILERYSQWENTMGSK